jgi:hypothetical protein
MATISEVIRPVRSSSRRIGRRRGNLDIRPGDIAYIEVKGYEGYATARGLSKDELVFTPHVTIWDPARVALSRVTWHGARSRSAAKESV